MSSMISIMEEMMKMQTMRRSSLRKGIGLYAAIHVVHLDHLYYLRYSDDDDLSSHMFFTGDGSAGAVHRLLQGMNCDYCLLVI